MTSPSPNLRRLNRVFFLTHHTLVSASPPMMVHFTRRGFRPNPNPNPNWGGGGGGGMGDVVETAAGEQYLIASQIPTTDLALRMSHEPNVLVVDVDMNTHIPLARVGGVSRFEVDADLFFAANSGQPSAQHKAPNPPPLRGQ